MPLRVLHDFCINLIDFFDTFLGEHFLCVPKPTIWPFFMTKSLSQYIAAMFRSWIAEMTVRSRLFYDIHQLQLILDIEVVRRFVKDQARRLLRKRAGQNDPLLFAAG